MAASATYNCKRCGDPFTARTADRKRGWARFCSKSCKAIRQTQTTGYAGPGSRDDYPLGDFREGWDDHKAWGAEGNSARNKEINP